MSNNHEYYEILLMKGVDGQLSDEEQAALDAHLATCASCRGEYADFRKIKGATDGIRDRILQDAALESIHDRLNASPADKVGFLLILVGSLVLAAMSAWLFFGNAEIPLWYRLSTGAIVGGAALLFGNLLRKRLQQAPHDPYNDIDM